MGPITLKLRVILPSIIVAFIVLIAVAIFDDDLFWVLVSFAAMILAVMIVKLKRLAALTVALGVGSVGGIVSL
jgi:hypothetical protein